jgi:S-adenosylmethionine-diacylglycerol 3-amino-3-carboxypropyl transferase
VIHCGRLERYLESFRRFVLPLIHRRALVDELLAATDLAEQDRIYEKRWDRRRWRWFFRLFFSQSVMSRCGRPPAWFAQVTMRDVGGTLLERARLGLTRVPTRGNYFLEYMLTGGYKDLEAAPPYLRRANFETLQEGVKRVRLVGGDLNAFLSQALPGEYSCFNLSDVFEYMSPAQTELTWQNLVRIARSRSRLAFRTLFVPRPAPPHAAVQVREISSSASTRERDRTFFYDQFLALETS